MSERLRIEIEQEDDGRWIAEVPDLPGVLVYGTSREDAIQKAEALACPHAAELRRYRNQACGQSQVRCKHLSSRR